MSSFMIFAPFKLLFLLPFLLIYWRLDWRKQNVLLLAASYAFYLCLNWRFPLLILVPTVVDYACGIRIFRAETKKRKTFFLWISIASDLCLLGFFKYFDFFVQNLTAVLGAAGIRNVAPLHLNIILPVGISYYLFKSMSYTIDVYRCVITRPVRNLGDYALYLSFFPHFLAGPIERAVHFMPQVAGSRRFEWAAFGENLYLIFWGVFKKFFIADNLALVVANLVSADNAGSGFQILLAAYAFTFQLYADFSGYSDIAIGTAGCLGFKTMLNFNLPFFAKSPLEIWRRWHISLSSWCRDYVFYYFNRLRIRLGATRAEGAPGAILATMAVMGLWHGAAWPFVLWGLYHGVLMSVQVLARPLWGKFGFSFTGRRRALVDALKIILTFHLFVFGELLFMAQSAPQIGDFMHRLVFGFAISRDSLEIAAGILFFVSILVALEIMQYIKNDLLIVLRWHFLARDIFYVVLLVLLLMLGQHIGKQFLYVAF
ncbi:MAG TPA: MBOAT family O-acyltransferase [Patescibacteria group bacterium]|nr:MBOAT family O-acyltransferase [Patescibacteria group bacterium]